MIRKMLVLAAAVAMPAAAMAGVAAVGGSGVASAKALAPIDVTCSLSGSITFASPGLSHNGSLTNKSTEATKTAITPGGGGACPTKTIKNTISTPTTTCTGDTTVDAPICAIDLGTKTESKDPNYYDSLSGFVTAGTSDIQTSLANGVATTDNGTKIVLDVADGSVAQIVGGACGSNVGFGLTGPVKLATGASTTATYTMNICLGEDAGTGVSGSFVTDFIAGLTGGTAVISGSQLDSSTSQIAITGF